MKKITKIGSVNNIDELIETVNEVSQRNTFSLPNSIPFKILELILKLK